MTPASCPICGRPNPRRELRTPRLEIFLCRGCRHRVAVHTEPQATGDYHEQYEQGEFLRALEATRRRQGRLIASLLRSLMKDPGGVLDFGAGRGWFLEECRAAGLEHLAGVDSSTMSVRWLREKGFGAGETLREPFGFAPRVLTLLDVLEHVPPPQAADFLRQLIRDLDENLEMVVVKVPDASGLLYRLASTAARLRVPGPLEQLYQVGTSPPHFSYFSRDSLRIVLKECGLIILVERGDSDFEPGSFHGRVKELAAFPTAAARLAGGGLLFTARLTGWLDSRIMLARPA